MDKKNRKRQNVKFDNLKYGFLISVTTMFGGSTAQLFAQTDKGEPVAVESNEAYKRQFLQSVAPDRENIRVDFMVDSVDVRTSNGTLLPDVNVIQLLAYLDTDSDEYQSYMASRHIVAHEMWHRICMMNDVLEKPMAASQYRNGRDNFEISASIVQLLTFRDDYIRATPEERVLLHEMEDPKIRMYLMAVDNGIVRPFSDDKKDFDFEMEFIAKTVSGYWNGTLAHEYAPLHNMLTEKSGRKEFSSPAYDKNFNDDIKKMNLIGGIDFSKLYNFRDVRLPKLFEKGYKADTTHLEQTPGAPNYEAWITQKSQLKRYSRQTLELPNFTGNRLVQEREARPKEERVQPFKILPMAVADKIYPYMKHPLSAAVQLVGEKKEIRLYPHGAMDIIGRPNSEGVVKIKTVNLDGSYETGQLLRGRKNGTFVYFNRDGKEISHCTFRLGRALDGAMVLPFQGQRIVYRYEGGVLQSMDIQDKKGNVRTICTMENGRPLSTSRSASSKKALRLFRPVSASVSDSCRVRSAYRRASVRPWSAWYIIVVLTASMQIKASFAAGTSSLCSIQFVQKASAQVERPRRKSMFPLSGPAWPMTQSSFSWSRRRKARRVRTYTAVWTASIAGACACSGASCPRHREKIKTSMVYDQARNMTERVVLTPRRYR